LDIPVAPAKNNQERGGLSGIGGQMDETEDKPAAAIEPQGDETESAGRERSGAESLRAEADLILRLEGKEIAKALAAESKKGHIQSARFLYDLADENCKFGAVEMVRTARSLALQWTTEPLWAGEADEETVKPERGGLEPAD
jgi:hypothetical protein